MSSTPNSSHEKRFFRRSFGHRDSLDSTRSTNNNSNTLKERARAGKLKSSGSSVSGKTPVQALQLPSAEPPSPTIAKPTSTTPKKSTPSKIPGKKSSSPTTSVPPIVNKSPSKDSTVKSYTHNNNANSSQEAVRDLTSQSLGLSSSEEQECQTQAVRVAVRLRPLNPLEVLASKRSLPLLSSPSKSDDAYDSFKAWTVEDIDGKEVLVQKGAGRKAEGKNMFSFDNLFQEHMGTAHVYENFARPIVKAVLTGKHGTIFTYGTSGSGKTHSMQGDGKNGSLHKDGIIQLAVRDLFNHIKRDSGKREYVMRISFFEIYNEQVRDLLSMNHHHHHTHNANNSNNRSSPTKGSRSPTKSSSRNSPSAKSHASSRFSFTDVAPAPTVNIGSTGQGNGVTVASEKKQVSSVDDVLKLLYAGNQNRAVATTIMNDTSSRSHAIFRLTIESRERIAGRRENNNSSESDHIVRVSALNFVDLAGSENTTKSGTVGSRRRESGKINQSLLSLSQVIHALSLPPKKRPKFINYRNSKLTRILQPHLSGNAVLAVLCCATPARANLEETRGTLKFGASAKRIQMKPVVNEVVDDKALIKKLQQELKEAQDAIKSLAKSKKKTSGSPNNSDSDAAVVPLIGEVESPHDSSNSSPVTVGSCGSRDREREQRLEMSMEREQTPNHSRIEPSPLASPDVTPERVASPNNLTDSKLYDIAQVLDGRFRSCDQDSKAERSIQHDCNSTLSDFSARRPPTIRVVQDSPPSEVTIIRSPLSDIGDDVDVNVRLNDAEERAKFLEEKLEAADRLVELMTRDLRNARLCIHELVFRNVRLENQLAGNTSMTHDTTVPSTVDVGMEDESHKDAAVMPSERIGI